MPVSTLLSTDTVQERMYSEPLNGIPTSPMTTLGGGTVLSEIIMHSFICRTDCELLEVYSDSISLQYLAQGWRC